MVSIRGEGVASIRLFGGRGWQVSGFSIGGDGEYQAFRGERMVSIRLFDRKERRVIE